MQVVGIQTIGWPYAIFAFMKYIDLYIYEANIIIIITNVYFVIFHPINGWHKSLPIICNLGR